MRNVAATGSIRLEDVHLGIAAWVYRTTLHLLRLSDGKSTAISLPPRSGSIHARIEDAGLSYSYNVRGNGPRGRLAFVPTQRVVAALS
jgi:hypothetical protein